MLGVAAIVTSVSSPPEREGNEPRRAQTDRAEPPGASPQAGGGGPIAVRFNAEGQPRLAVIGAGRPAVVTVAVEEPGEVRLEGLGLTAPAAPLTPARFDVLPSQPGRHRVRFLATGEREGKTIGVLQVESTL